MGKQRMYASKTILKKNKIGKLTLPDFKTHYNPVKPTG